MQVEQGGNIQFQVFLEFGFLFELEFFERYHGGTRSQEWSGAGAGRILGQRVQERFFGAFVSVQEGFCVGPVFVEHGHRVQGLLDRLLHDFGADERFVGYFVVESYFADGMFDHNALQVALRHVPFFDNSADVHFADFSDFIGGNLEFNVSKGRIQTFCGQNYKRTVIHSSEKFDLQDSCAKFVHFFLKSEEIGTRARNRIHLNFFFFHGLGRAENVLEYALLDGDHAEEEFVAVVAGDLRLDGPHVSDVDIFDLEGFLLVHCGGLVEHEGLSRTVADEFEVELAREHLAGRGLQSDALAGQG